jgi:hypothetical protein
VRAVQFDYRIGGNALGRVEKIRDLGVLLDSWMTFLCHIEAILFYKNFDHKNFGHK